MAGPKNVTTPNLHSTSTFMEEVIDRFEDAWQRGTRPVLADYLPPAGDAGRLPLLLELVHVDLEWRLKAGDRGPLVEDYLPTYPEELGNPEALLELLAAEYQQRWKREPGLSSAEYLARFPDLAPRLSERLKVRVECPHCRAWAELAAQLDQELACPGCGKSFPVRPPCPPTEVDSNHPRPAAPARASWPIIPGYEILEELGRGGMGVVYKARQTDLQRTVALKMILGGAPSDDRELQRFRLEAEAAARLQHPNIVQIHAIGEQEGRPFLSLEYVSGGTLDKRLAGTPLPAPQVARLAEELARAIHFAHQHGIVHRDLKPANILVASGGREPPDSLQSSGGSRPPLAELVPKITDFGLAKKLDQEQGQTQSGAILGTPSYMAPEQAWGKSSVREVGPSADIYALGAVLYEMLTGRPPFRGETTLDTIQMVLTEEPVPPRRLRPKVPRDLETICLKCLHKQPRKRYATALELAEDLRRFLEGEPIRARPVGVVERAGKWARRRPAWAVLLGVSALAAAALVTVAGLYTARLHELLASEREQRQLADENLKLARNAVNNYFIKTSQTKLLDVPGLQTLRSQLLESALVFYQGLAQQYGNDPALRADLAATQHQIGVVYHALGRTDEAGRAFEAALKLRRGLAADHADDLYLRNDLAETLNAYAAAIKDRRRRREALGRYQEALALREALVAQAPQEPVFQDSLALTLTDLAMLLKEDSGQGEEAMRLMDRARVIREKLVQRYPQIPEHLYYLAKVYNQLANLQTDHRRKPDALVSYTRALELRRGLANRFKDNINYQNELAWSYNNIGLVLSEIGRPEQALENYAQAVAIRRRLAEENPAVIEFQHNLASSYNNLGLLLYQISGRDREARDALQKGLEIRLRLVRRYPRNLLFKERLAHVQQNLGNLNNGIGLKAEAVTAYTGTLKIREELAAADATNTSYRKHLGSTLNLVGNLHRTMDRYDAALAVLRRSRDLFGRLVRDNPDTDKFKDDLVETHTLLGRVHHATGAPARALASYDAALAVAEKLVAANPGVTEYEGHLAELLTFRSAALADVGRADEALATVRRALQISRRITAAKPELVERQADLVGCYSRQGVLLRAAKRGEEALASLEAARDLRERLLQADPNNLDDRGNLAAIYEEIGLTLLGLGRLGEAVRALEQAVVDQRQAHEKGPQVPAYRRVLIEYLLQLARVRRELGQSEEAAALLQEADKLTPAPPDQGAPGPDTRLVAPRMSFAEAVRPYERFKYSLQGRVAADGKVQGGGLGCSAFTSVVLHRMRDGDGWLKKYNPRVHEWYGDRAAAYFGLKRAGRFPAGDLLDPVKTKEWLKTGKVQAGTLYYFNARKGKHGHVGFVRVGKDGTLDQAHYSELARGLYRGDYRAWLRTSMYRGAAVELYVVPEAR